MDGRRGPRDHPFGLSDPFAGFGGLRGHHSLIAGMIGGQDPFDHPFFTDPFSGLSESHPFGFSGGSPLMNTHPHGLYMGGSPLMNAHPPGFPIGGSPFMHALPPGFPIGGRPFMNAHPPHFPIGANPFPRSPLPFGFSTDIPSMNMQPSEFCEGTSSHINKSKGPIIEELNSDDEEEVDDNNEEKDNPKKHNRSKDLSYVVDQDYQSEGNNKRQMLCNDKSVSRNEPCVQGHSFTFQSSTVMHGGSNGAYYTQSRNLRTGTDGLTIDESKEADSTTGRAAHRLSRGIHDKGHTVTRNLQSDGKVDTMQILHNLEKDDLTGFEQTWNSTARKNLPGLSERLYVQDGSETSAQFVPQNRGGWALPSAERPNISGSLKPGGGRRSDSYELQNPQRSKDKDGDRTHSSRDRF